MDDSTDRSTGCASLLGLSIQYINSKLCDPFSLWFSFWYRIILSSHHFSHFMNQIAVWKSLVTSACRNSCSKRMFVLRLLFETIFLHSKQITQKHECGVGDWKIKFERSYLPKYISSPNTYLSLSLCPLWSSSTRFHWNCGIVVRFEWKWTNEIFFFRFL